MKCILHCEINYNMKYSLVDNRQSTACYCQVKCLENFKWSHQGKMKNSCWQSSVSWLTSMDSQEALAGQQTVLPSTFFMIPTQFQYVVQTIEEKAKHHFFLLFVYSRCQKGPVCHRVCWGAYWRGHMSRTCAKRRRHHKLLHADDRQGLHYRCWSHGQPVTVYEP